MSDSRQGKSAKCFKEKESVRSKPYRSKCSSQRLPVESKTPPLPTKNNSTLEELLEKRESLKQELKKIVKYSDNEKNNNSKRRRISKEYYSDLKRKRNYKENDNKSNGFSNSKNNIVHESSPDIDHTQAESEDEETIIQQRRQRRKEIMNKFQAAVEKHIDIENKINKPINEDKNIKMTDEDQKISKQVTDMFSEKDEFDTKVNSDKGTKADNDSNLNLVDNWDDADGYYNVRVGDILNNKYTVKGLLGQGVFANVVRAQDNSDRNDYVAIKIVRNNDLMYRTSLKEISLLKEIRNADPSSKNHCVKLLGHFMHKGHLCILLESLHMDLRAVIKKYGKHRGINMKALYSYSRQLLLALRLLKKLGIVHADIKPDNILVNEKKNVLKLCDFGSAVKNNSTELTPYLVSRFYRAPEIILGVSYKHSVDIWSTACTIYEMATGRIMFTGISNNKMLHCFMDMKGKFSSKVIKKGKFKDQHFNYNNNFLLHKKDEFTGREKVIEIAHITPSRDLHNELNKSFRNVTAKEGKKLMELRDLLDKMTMLDSSQRISVSECLKHPFISEDLDTDKK